MSTSRTKQGAFMKAGLVLGLIAMIVGALVMWSSRRAMDARWIADQRAAAEADLLSFYDPIPIPDGTTLLHQESEGGGSGTSVLKNGDRNASYSLHRRMDLSIDQPGVNIDTLIAHFAGISEHWAFMPSSGGARLDQPTRFHWTPGQKIHKSHSQDVPRTHAWEQTGPNRLVRIAVTEFVVPTDGGTSLPIGYADPTPDGMRRLAYIDISAYLVIHRVAPLSHDPLDTRRDEFNAQPQ